MALRLWCCGSGASLCGDRSPGARPRLVIGPPRSAPKSRCTVGGMLPAAAITAPTRAVVCSSAHVGHPCDDKDRVVHHQLDVTLRPRREGLHDGNNEGARNKKRGGGRAPVSSEKMDQWMQECIVEIVRNIGEAPFLVYVFCNDNDGTRHGSALKLEMEAANRENWSAIKDRWDRGVAAPPDGVILVEELHMEDDDGARGIPRTREELTTWDGGEEDGAAAAAAAAASSSSDNSKTWGVLVQGWGGVDCDGCYILNTCRVRSASGFCTHFCLTRARCFEDTADVQLKKLWLVGLASART